MRACGPDSAHWFATRAAISASPARIAPDRKCPRHVRHFMETLSWMFKLVDQVTGPAGKMVKGLKGFAGGVKDAAVGVKDFGGKVVDWMKGLDAALGVVEKVGKGLVELGKKALDFGAYVVHAAEFKKQTFAGLDALEGSARMAEAARKTLELMANNAGKDTAVLVDKFKELRVEGFGTQDAMDAIAASLSVAAANGDKAGDSTLDLLKSVKTNSKGLFDTTALASVTKIGVPVDRFKQSLAKLKGVTVEELDGMVKAGQVTADEGVAAILDTIHDRFDKGAGLGALAKQLGGGSVTGQLQVLQNNLQKLFGDTAITTPFVNALKNLNSLFSESSETGKKLRDFLTRMFEKVGDLVDAISDPEAIGSAIEGIVDFLDAIDTVVSQVMPYLKALGGPLWDGIKSAVKPLIGIFDKIFPEKGGGADSNYIAMFKTLGTVLGWVLGIIVDLVAWFVAITAATTAFAWVIIAGVVHGLSMLVDGAIDAWDAIVDFIDGIVDAAGDLWDSALSIGSDFIDGLIQGISDGWASVVKTVTGLADAVVGTIKKKLGIASPSKVMATLGGFTAVGFAEGIDSKTDIADASMGALVSPPSLVGAAGGAPSAPSGGRTSVSIGDVVVNVPASTQDPQGFGRVAGNEVRAQLLSLFEELGLEVGPRAA
ncbi:MAG: hypothetical protein HYV09_03370 [Deltaproteobacteria bacterium]|nr:hypothetical protein [Deltaproteobacteria bacterium]